MPISRREFLKGLGVVTGALGMSAAGYDRIIPYINQPDNLIPGVPSWYATSCRECPAGCGMLLKSRESRIIKSEGIPDHPISRGALCARGQAAVMAVYDPDRIRHPMTRNDSGDLVKTTWEDSIKRVGEVLQNSRGRIAFITDLQTGSLNTLMRSWLTALGSGRLVVYEPINYESVKAVNGGIVPRYRISQADYLISFAADFLETWISPIEYAGEFQKMREVKDGRRAGFAYIGPRLSMTAANADVRLIIPPGAELEVAQAILAGGANLYSTAHKYSIDSGQLRKVSQALREAASPLALPGFELTAARAAQTINSGRGGGLIDTASPHAVTYIASQQDILDLISDMEAGNIDTLVVYGSNPAYSLPESSRFEQAAKKIPNIISLSSYMDETTTLANWVLPSNTPYESWGDYQPYPNVANLMQPTMGSLYNTRQAGDILIQLAEAAGIDTVGTFNADSFYGYLRRRWGIPLAPGEGPGTVNLQFEELLRRGGRWGEGTGELPAPGAQPAVAPVTAASPTSALEANEVRLYAFPHIYYYDGRNANRRWLQEMPEPVIQTVWGNCAELHPDTANKLGISTDDVIEVRSGRESIQIPAYVWQGVAPDTVAIAMGAGHTDYGRYAEGYGANVFKLADLNTPVVTVKATGKSKWVSRIRANDSQHGRDIVETVAVNRIADSERHVRLPLPEGYTKEDFYPGHEHKPHRWAMIVDLDKCIGCHACVTACYAENNVGIVGSEGIWRRREMAWLRIDRYFDWNDKATPVLFQPMLCQHCDSAPCEPVCPVYAAAHSEDGINMQVYNRCVGTRYCSNNCPYKVRRFNWFDYDWPEPLNYQLNPDVTVRCRGVMEKCTFCVQRIRLAQINARREGRSIRDGEVTPACAQTCPTGVYVFGDLMDPESKVSKLIRTDPRAYQVLYELNTKPGVVYLKKIVSR